MRFLLPNVLLAIDTCGPAGSVALARLLGESAAILGQRELEGRTYSATLVTAIDELLGACSLQLSDLAAIVIVNGPGSFTGVRVGLAAAKGLAEALDLPLVAVSRLEVLAAYAGTTAAALDAHRHEIFLRSPGAGAAHGGLLDEVLADEETLLALGAPQGPVACGDEQAAARLEHGWPAAQILRVAPPTAADALTLCAERVVRGEFADRAMLDGHYLRRSDAEIFGEPLSV